jgi:hypothetical protein
MEMANSTDSATCGMADAYAVREAWLSFVKPAMEQGKLDKIPTVRARTPREREQARVQQYYLSRKVFGGFGDNYDRITWGNHHE